MSRSVPSGLGITGETPSVARGWKVTLKDGSILGFTDHDENKLINGVTYLAASGMTASSIETSGALNVDNLEVEGMLVSPSITEQELIAGRWDHAAIEIFLFNWRDPAAGEIILRTGRLGELSADGKHFRAEIRGLTQQLQQSIGDVYQPACRADFGDDKCKFNKATVTTTTTVQTVTTNGLTITSAALTQPADYFGAGELTWTTGANVGLKGEVKSSLVGSITLQIPPAYMPAIGDGFSVVAGCRKRAIEDCQTKFNNLLNFRGEPDLPGLYKIVSAPISSA